MAYYKRIGFDGNKIATLSIAQDKRLRLLGEKLNRWELSKWFEGYAAEVTRGGVDNARDHATNHDGERRKVCILSVSL